MRALCAFNNLNIVKEVYRKKENWEKQEADEELWVCVGGGRGWQEVLGLWMGMWERVGVAGRVRGWEGVLGARVKNRRSGDSPAQASYTPSGWELLHYPGTLLAS